MTPVNKVICIFMHGADKFKGALIVKRYRQDVYAVNWLVYNLFSSLCPKESELRHKNPVCHGWRVDVQCTLYKYRRSRVLLLKMNTKTSKQKNVKKKIKNLLKSYLNVFVNCAKTTFEISLWYPDL